MAVRRLRTRAGQPRRGATAISSQPAFPMSLPLDLRSGAQSHPALGHRLTKAVRGMYLARSHFREPRLRAWGAVQSCSWAARTAIEFAESADSAPPLFRPGLGAKVLGVTGVVLCSRQTQLDQFHLNSRGEFALSEMPPMFRRTPAVGNSLHYCEWTHRQRGGGAVPLLP